MDALREEFAAIDQRLVEIRDLKSPTPNPPPWWVDRPLTFIERLAEPGSKLLEWFMGQSEETTDKLGRMVEIGAPLLAALFGGSAPASGAREIQFPSTLTVQVNGLQTSPGAAQLLDEIRAPLAAVAQREGAIEQRAEGQAQKLEALYTQIAAAQEGCDRTVQVALCDLNAKLEKLQACCDAKPAAPTTLAEIAALLAAVVWPLVVTAVVWLLREPLSQLLPHLKVLRYKDLSAEFDRGLESLKSQVKLFSPPTETRSKTEEFADEAPNAAVFAAWKELEAAAKVRIDRAEIVLDYDVATPFKQMERVLSNVIGVEARKMKVFRDLRRLRNRLAHAPDFEVTPAQAREYVRAAQALAAHLRGES